MKDILKLLSTFFICLIGIGFTACDKEDKDESFIDIKFENDGLYYHLISNSTVEIIEGENEYTNKTIIIPSSVTNNGKTYNVTSIGEDAFRSCDGLTSITIPNSVTNIGDYAFWGCDGLTSVTIPNSVTSIGEEAFNECNGLTSITVEEGNSVYDSRDNCNAIIETATNTLIQGINNTIIPNSVTSIGERAFSSCYGLTSITIPNSVTSIGYAAFSSCFGLTSITIPNSVTSIGNYAFEGCDGLTSITIPNSVTSIGNYAFGSCHGLTSVTIGNSVTSIGDNAFYHCDGLTNIYLLSELPPTCNWSFTNYKMATLYVPKGSLDAYKAAKEWINFKNIEEWEPTSY